MSQAPAQSEPVPEGTASFFRQGSWLMFANIAAGAFMWAVHFLSKRIPPEEYGALGALLAVILVVPMLPLQMVFAQQTANNANSFVRYEIMLADRKQRPTFPKNPLIIAFDGGIIATGGSFVGRFLLIHLLVYL